MVNWDTIAIPFQGGLDTKTDRKAASPAKFVELENGVFTKRGTIRKRHGYDLTEPEDSDGNAVRGEALATLGDSLLLLGDKRIYSYEDESDKWLDQGFFNQVTIETKPVERNTASQTGGDRAEAHGITVRAWVESSAGVIVAISDTASGAGILRLSGGTNLAAGSKPRVVRVGAFVHVVFAVAGATDLMTLPINPWQAAATVDGDALIIASDMHADAIFDVCENSERTNALFAWYSTATATVRYGRLEQSGSVATKLDLGSTAEIGIISIAANATLGVILYSETDTSPNQLVQLVPVTDINAVMVAGSATVAGTGVFTQAEVGITSDNEMVFAGQTDLTGSGATQPEGGPILIATATMDAVGALTLTGGYTLNHGYMGSSVFAVDGQLYVFLKLQSTKQLQNCYFLYCFSDGPRVVGQVALGEAHPIVHDQHQPKPQLCDDGKMRCLLTTRKQVASLFGDTFLQSGLLEVAIDPVATAYSAVEAGKALYVAGGILWHCDGGEPVESGFLLYPELDIEFGSTDPADHDAVDVATAGAIPAATYGYKVFYEWPNRSGELMRSTAFSFSVAAPGSKKTILTIPTLSQTLKGVDNSTRAHVSIAVYRTAGDGNIYRRCSGIDPTVTTGDNHYLFNDPTALSVTFTDNMLDAVLLRREQDPQTGGIVDNVAPRASTVLLEAQRRLFQAGGAVPSNQTGYTKLRIDGGPIEANDALNVELPDRGGDVSALANLNDNLVVFKEHQIYVVSGQGPNNAGFGDFQEPVQIATDVGCVDARALVETPLGFIFYSNKGLRLLNRSFEVEYIGAEVEGFNGQTIAAANLIPDQNLVVFLSSDGTSLAFDYEHRQWTSFTGHRGISATLWANKYCYLNADGQVYRQNPAKYTDGNVAYRLRAKTGPLRIEGLQQLWRCKRIYLLGEYFSEHSLRMNVWFNREGAPRETTVWRPEDFIDSSTWGDDAVWGDDAARRTYATATVSVLALSGTTQVTVDDASEFPASGEIELSEGGVTNIHAYSEIIGNTFILTEPTQGGWAEDLTSVTDLVGTLVGVDTVWGGDIDSRDYQVSYGLESQKCQSLSLEFVEVPGTEPGRSFELAELAIEWRPMAGLGRLAAARRN